MGKKKGATKGNKSACATEKKKHGAKRANAKKGGRSTSTDDDDDDNQFRGQLLNQGHLIREMNSDGNCLFRSLSDQLYNDDGDEHGTVRKEICDYILNNKDEFQSFLLMDEDDEDIMNIDDYVEHMRAYSTWGSDIEIVAASRRYMRGIKVFSTHGVLRFDSHEENNDQLDHCEDLLISYHGNDHYNSVCPIDDSNRRRKQPHEVKHTRKSAKSNLAAESVEVESTANNNQEVASTTTGNSKKGRAPKKGSPCPCGSGLTYKKCCLAREKSKKRLAKMNNFGDAHSREDEEKEEFIGEFKVLSI